jgi:hypothetical protein
MPPSSRDISDVNDDSSGELMQNAVDTAVLRRFLLVGTAEFHPVAVCLEHRADVIDAAACVEEGRHSDNADDDLLAVLFVEAHLVLRCQLRRLQVPRVLLGTDFFRQGISTMRGDRRKMLANYTP